jgi:hypothetical protein
MAFVSLPGITGKVYVPEENENHPRKHPCKDCYCCQCCSDDRCNVCLTQPDSCKKSKRWRE